MERRKVSGVLDAGDVADHLHVEQRGDARHDVLARGRCPGRAGASSSAPATPAAPPPAPPGRARRPGRSAFSTLATPGELGRGLRRPRRPAPAHGPRRRSCRAAATALRVGWLTADPVWSARTRTGHAQITFASLRSLSTSSATEPTFLPAWRFGGSSTFSTVRPRRRIDAEIGRLHRLDRLLARLHDVGQRGVARLVQPQVGGDDGRQLELHRLQAAIDLARHLQPAIGLLDLARR